MVCVSCRNKLKQAYRTVNMRAERSDSFHTQAYLIASRSSRRLDSVSSATGYDREGPTQKRITPCDYDDSCQISLNLKGNPSLTWSDFLDRHSLFIFSQNNRHRLRLEERRQANTLQLARPPFQWQNGTSKRLACK